MGGRKGEVIKKLKNNNKTDGEKARGTERAAQRDESDGTSRLGFGSIASGVRY